MYALTDFVFIIKRCSKPVIIHYAAAASAELLFTAAGGADFSVYKRERIFTALTGVFIRAENRTAAENAPFRPQNSLYGFQ